MPNPKGDSHAGLYKRLIANIAEPCNDQACWVWIGRTRRRYPATNIREGGRHISIQVHRAVLVLTELEGEHELFWPLYEAYSVAGFDADHLCFCSPRCINPDHLQWLPKEEHVFKRHREVHPDAAARSAS